MPSVIDKWNEKYAGEGLVFGTTPNGFLTQHATFYRPGGHVLAVGDGEGRNGVWLAEQGFDVLSVDGARNGVTKARQQADQRGVSSRFHTQCVDLLDWDWPVAAFDGVACLHLYFMPDIRPRLHQAMMDALKPGGIFILEVFHPDHVGRGLGGPSLPELCYSAQDLKTTLPPITSFIWKKPNATSPPPVFTMAGAEKSAVSWSGNRKRPRRCGASEY